MARTIAAYVDGKVIVPDEPVRRYQSQRLIAEPEDQAHLRDSLLVAALYIADDSLHGLDFHEVAPRNHRSNHADFDIASGQNPERAKVATLSPPHNRAQHWHATEDSHENEVHIDHGILRSGCNEQHGEDNCRSSERNKGADPFPPHKIDIAIDTRSQGELASHVRQLDRIEIRY